MYQANTKVSGTYYGRPYTGTVREMRPHTIHHTRIEHTIELDAPIMVFGALRTGIIIATCDDNEENTIQGA